MKKLLIILAMISIMTMALSGDEVISNKIVLNNYIETFQMQKITHNGVEGFFIPLTGHKQMVSLLNDYIYLQNILIEKDKRIQKLERYEIMNFRLKTALGISISINVGSIFLCAGLGILTYNLAKGEI